MAKSPFKALSKFNNTSGRLTKRSGMSRVSLKNGHLQLPVTLSHGSNGLQSHNQMNFRYNDKGKADISNTKKELIYKLKNEIKSKYFKKELKNDCLNNFMKVNLYNSNSSNSNSFNSKITKSKKVKLGIYERKRCQYMHNHKLVLNKSKQKYNLLKSSKITNKQKDTGKLNVNKINPKNQKNEATQSHSKNPISNYTLNNLDSRDRQNDFKKNEICSQNINKVCITKSDNLIKYPKRVSNEKKLKDIDTITVNTCNTLQEVSNFKIQEELPNRKYRNIKLSHLQKHLQIYSGKYILFFD